MIIKPWQKEGNELWFKIPQGAKHPDRDALYFGVSGEFSPYSDIAFTKHEQRYAIKEKPYWKQFNGDRIRKLREYENFWY